MVDGLQAGFMDSRKGVNRLGLWRFWGTKNMAITGVAVQRLRFLKVGELEGRE